MIAHWLAALPVACSMLLRAVDRLLPLSLGNSRGKARKQNRQGKVFSSPYPTGFFFSSSDGLWATSDASKVIQGYPSHFESIWTPLVRLPDQCGKSFHDDSAIQLNPDRIDPAKFRFGCIILHIPSKHLSLWDGFETCISRRRSFPDMRTALLLGHQEMSVTISEEIFHSMPYQLSKICFWIKDLIRQGVVIIKGETVLQLTVLKWWSITMTWRSACFSCCFSAEWVGKRVDLQWG